jgi:hypothetical protein
MLGHPTTLDLMKQSKCFKFMAALSIFCLLVGLLLEIVFASGACKMHVRNYSCYELTPVSGYECTR